MKGGIGRRPYDITGRKQGKLKIFYGYRRKEMLVL